MENPKKRYLISFIIFSIIGTAMHFVYDIIGSNIILNGIVPINESVWEHLKLIFYPSLIFFVCNYDYKAKNNKATYTASFVTASTISMLFCIMSYYSILYFFKFVPGVINIVIYYLSMFILFVLMYIMNYITEELHDNFNFFCEITILIYIFIFYIYTYFPPNLIIFKSP